MIHVSHHEAPRMTATHLARARRNTQGPGIGCVRAPWPVWHGTQQQESVFPRLFFRPVVIASIWTGKVVRETWIWLHVNEENPGSGAG
jgi:hypothetical protein